MFGEIPLDVHGIGYAVRAQITGHRNSGAPFRSDLMDDIMYRLLTLAARPQIVLATLLMLSILADNAKPATPPFDPNPWLEDLEQARTAFATLYADLEWDVVERHLDLNAVFDRARAEARGAHDTAEARAAFDELAHQFIDGHTRFNWWAADGPPHATPRADDCQSLGYDRKMVAAPLATLLPGFVPLSPAPTPRFSAGTVRHGQRLIAVLQIPLFMPEGFPEVCEAAVAALKLDPNGTCADDCRDRINDVASAQLTRDLASALAALRAAHADVLLIDITGNGGGSEWAEAAARMVTTKRLASIPMYFIKGEHWTQRFTRQESELRAAAATATGDDRAFLIHLAGQVADRKRDAQTPCDGTPLWRGERPTCGWLGDAFYSTGLLRMADPAVGHGKPWGPLVFTPLKYPYQEGLWRGPLIVLTDGRTGSAAEQFAAELQDNHAALIVGARTAGGGCGHTDGGTPTTLKNSHAILELPDCVRIRTGHRNLADGVEPDLPIPLNPDDTPAHRAQLLSVALGPAVDRAIR